MVVVSRHAIFLALAVGAFWTCPCGAWEANRAWLGIEICDNLGRTAASETRGILVLNVEEGSPASLAGITSHDVVVQLDGQPLATASEFVCEIAARKPGSVARLVVVRNNQRWVTNVTLGRWPDDLQLTPSHCTPAVG